LVLGLSTSPAQADSPKQRCIAAFEEGQRSQMVGDLQHAIEQFEGCAVSACPAAAQRECSRLLDVAQAAIPTIRFELEFGNRLAERPVMLSVDDIEPRAYEGEVLRVNPGKHRFVFECEGCAPVTRRIVFAEGDSKRKEVVLSPAAGDAEGARNSGLSSPETQPSICPPNGARPGTATSSESAPAPVAPGRGSAGESARLRDILIMGSAATLATAGGLGFIGFGLEARRAERDLAECTPDCSSSRIAEVKRSYVLANASLGGGVLALGGATIWWFGLRPSTRTRNGAASHSQWSVELGPINRVTRTF
jgi:hypothetical protein